MNFESLIGSINQVQDALQAQAAHAVNLSLTARNWLVGYYIVEFEQQGEDRAKYGENLLNNIAKELSRKGLEARRLREYRQFYRVYPQIGNNVIDYLKKNAVAGLSINDSQIWRLPTAKLQVADNQSNTIRQPASAKLQEQGSLQEEIWRLPTAKSSEEPWQTPADWLFNRLSATHLVFLSNIKEPLKRAFYEQETIRGCWTIKELDRQVSSLYYERMGLSKDKKALQRLTAKDSKQLSPREILHNPVTIEFLGLQSQDVYTETKLETAILNHLQQFLLEMGRGFCFEARQKRILIDQDYFKADLIFYHRILKCHVVIDLKIDRFRHEYASQLNLYLNYYKHEVMQEDDNPPIGLLLCTDYGETTVRYATEGLSQNLFVSKYRLQLPSEEEFYQYLVENISEQDYIDYKEEQKKINATRYDQ